MFIFRSQRLRSENKAAVHKLRSENNAATTKSEQRSEELLYHAPRTVHKDFQKLARMTLSRKQKMITKIHDSDAHTKKRKTPGRTHSELPLHKS